MRHANERAASFGMHFEKLRDGRLCGRIEVREGLVEYEQLRPPEQAFGERRLPSEPLRGVAKPRPESRSEIEPLADLSELCGVGSQAGSPQLEILPDGQLPVCEALRELDADTEAAAPER